MGEWEQPFKRGRYRKVKIVELEEPVLCARCQSPKRPKKPASRTYDGVPLCRRHAKPYEGRPDDRSGSTSVTTASAGLPTLGKRK
jgi:hypothetical protein